MTWYEMLLEHWLERVYIRAPVSSFDSIVLWGTFVEEMWIVLFRFCPVPFCGALRCKMNVCHTHI